MTEIEIAIDLIVPDNTAYTVLVALQRLGYDGLASVERSQIFRLTFDAPPSAAAELAHTLAHAEILFNPNKHRLSYALAEVLPKPDQSAPNGALEWEAVVNDRDDDTSGLVALLKGPFGMSGLRALTRGVAWRLHETDATAPHAMLEWSCRQLLANPYSQTFVVRARPARIVASV